MVQDKVVDIKQVRALQLVERGCEYAQENDIPAAIECFEKSISHFPTAEAYTYWGWMLSQRSEFEQAIELCKKAVVIDPDFGNPYNDIGSYLMRLGKNDEAIPWLEKAKTSKRYEPRHYPYINLGRIYFEKGWLTRAIEEFEVVLSLDSENEEVQEILEDLRLSVH
ncbi:MAG: tetratricopeptide repeat protein [Deltaproteobacteria bacterium]|nr:tetratricopeptide repeat protein [Deltaproteobacteria bacterium]